MERIRDLRTARGMTLMELAAAVGVTHVSVLQWERPGCYPNAAKLPAIAAALGCTVDELFAPAGDITSITA